MRWYYSIAGGHAHVRVYMHGAKCGDLCFRINEWEEVHAAMPSFVEFIKITSEEDME